MKRELGIDSPGVPGCTNEGTLRTLTPTKEFDILRSQFATSSWGGRRYPPWAFTEHGAVMLASVLNSDVAIETSVEVVRAFIRLREMLAAHKDLARRLDELERKYDGQFAAVFDAIRRLMAPPAHKPPEIGFHTLVPKRAAN